MIEEPEVAAEVRARVLYIFLDEAGNFDFSPNGTPFFIMGSLTKERPFFAYRELTELKYDLIESGADIEFFHAAEDRQQIRDKVFAIISKRLEGCTIDSTIVEKRKTGPALRPIERLYPTMLGYHLRYILKHVQWTGIREVLVFTDRVPVQKRRQAIEKAVKQTLASMLPAGAVYRIHHHDSKSNLDLQIADYCTWAIQRKWAQADSRSYDLIRPAIRSEFDIFRAGRTHYY
ncbi:MAG TPA: DUF3800 domain-containing protein [Syntrophobacteraceae bacterium]|nr:DUF3800 domain-containing protein [Syntrophobacteraceae bacterium]